MQWRRIEELRHSRLPGWVQRHAALPASLLVALTAQVPATAAPSAPGSEAADSAVTSIASTPAELHAAPAEAPTTPAAEAPPPTEAPAAAADPSSAAAPPAPSPVAPPIYRTLIPPPVVLHYAMQRGMLRGSGELQWRPSGDAYTLRLDGSIAGLRLLRQISEGGFDAAGLAPRRFSDQRLRGEPLVADFDQASRRISFSGSREQLPLLPGNQDRLSWMIQLAAIFSADPARLVPGAQVSMPVVGARADPAVWTLRYVGREDVRTDAGTVHAVKLERVGSGNGEKAVEVWLDPHHDYLPIRAILHSGDSSSALELTLRDMVVER